MRKRSNIMPRTDAGSLGKFVTRLVTGNPITEDISPLAKDRRSGEDPADIHRRSGGPKATTAKRRTRNRGK